MELLQYVRVQARANRLANHRLHETMKPLSHDAFHARRTSYFPSIARTLNHILAVDLYYVGALYRETELERKLREFQPCDTLAELAERQAQSDTRLIALCEGLNASSINTTIERARGTYAQTDRASYILSHLFMHQTHHRGQVHAMLSGTDIKPPQLDEFLLQSDAKYRVTEMATLGWNESEVYG